jgi:SAM-dependent methyltransferase
MSDASRHDAWQAGDNYDAYMGRWSRLIAPSFLDWLAPPGERDWLEVGCGTGVLSAAILARCQPRSLVALDLSEGFVKAARAKVPDHRAEFRVGNAQALPVESESRDIIVSALVLNFVPDRATGLAEMRRVARPGGRIGFYVWDYPGGGIEFMGAFWTAAAGLDPAAQGLTEDRRFPFASREGLTGLAMAAGLSDVESTPIEVETRFKDFDDYWRPFTLGAGPAPGYCVSLEPGARERLRQALDRTLPRRADGSIGFNARAWAVKGRAG